MNNLSLSLDQLRALSLKNKILPNNSFDLPLLLADPTLPSLDWKTTSEALQISTLIFGKRVQLLEQTVASMQAKEGRTGQQERKTRLHQSIRSQLSDKNKISQQIQGQFQSIYLTYLLKLPSLHQLLVLNASLELSFQSSAPDAPFFSQPRSFPLSDWLKPEQLGIEDTRQSQVDEFMPQTEFEAEPQWQNKQFCLSEEQTWRQGEQKNRSTTKGAEIQIGKPALSIRKNAHREKEFLRVNFQDSCSMKLESLSAAFFCQLKFKRKRTIMVPVFVPSNYLSRNYFPMPPLQLPLLTQIQQLDYQPPSSQDIQQTQHFPSDKANQKGMLDIKVRMLAKVREHRRLSQVLESSFSVGMNLIGLLHVASCEGLRLREVQGDIQW